MNGLCVVFVRSCKVLLVRFHLCHRRSVEKWFYLVIPSVWVVFSALEYVEAFIGRIVVLELEVRGFELPPIRIL